MCVAQLLGLWMLVKANCDMSDIPELQHWLKSLTEIKVVFVVYKTGFDRVFDAFGSKSRAQEVEDTHPLMFAVAVKQASKDMGPAFKLDKEFLMKKLTSTMKNCCWIIKDWPPQKGGR